MSKKYLIQVKIQLKIVKDFRCEQNVSSYLNFILKMVNHLRCETNPT